ncbi:MAG: hypothetical protein QM711_14975 [Micropruina sp.]|uniref:hypothetical protein n=1 Tax=Micropruina sp. TaxID=2737536 RepID=UPI0039E4D39A
MPRISHLLPVLSALLLTACAPAPSNSGTIGAPAPSPAASSPADRFAACLTEHGVEAIVQNGRVLTRAAKGSQPQVGNARPPGESAPSASPDARLAEAETACRKAVPDYQPPNDNDPTKG